MQDRGKCIISNYLELDCRQLAIKERRVFKTDGRMTIQRSRCTRARARAHDLRRDGT